MKQIDSLQLPHDDDDDFDEMEMKTKKAENFALPGFRLLSCLGKRFFLRIESIKDVVLQNWQQE